MATAATTEAPSARSWYEARRCDAIRQRRRDRETNQAGAFHAARDAGEDLGSWMAFRAGWEAQHGESGADSWDARREAFAIDRPAQAVRFYLEHVRGHAGKLPPRERWRWLFGKYRRGGWADYDNFPGGPAVASCVAWMVGDRV